MATPRKVSVAISIAGAPQVDVTSDVIGFTYEESLKEAGECLEIELDDSSKYYRGAGFVEKGTPIFATITTTDFNYSGDNKSRTTGVCFVDCLELSAKPASVTIKATSISPAMLNDQDDHAGFEGTSVQSTVDQFSDIYGLGTGGGITNEPGDNDHGLNLDMNRQDMDQQGNLKWRREQAQAIGCEVMAINNGIRTYRESDLEAKPATKTLTEGVSPIIRGQFTTNSIKKFASSVVTHMDVKTGTVTTSGTVTPTQVPTGTKSTYKSRKRSLQPGATDNNVSLAGNKINQGIPGNPFDEEA